MQQPCISPHNAAAIYITPQCSNHVYHRTMKQPCISLHNASAIYIRHDRGLCAPSNHCHSLEGIGEGQDSRAQSCVCDIENTKYDLNTQTERELVLKCINQKANRDLLASFCAGFVCRDASHEKYFFGCLSGSCDYFPQLGGSKMVQTLGLGSGETKIKLKKELTRHSGAVRGAEAAHDAS